MSVGQVDDGSGCSIEIEGEKDYSSDDSRQNQMASSERTESEKFDPDREYYDDPDSHDERPLRCGPHSNPSEEKYEGSKSESSVDEENTLDQFDCDGLAAAIIEEASRLAQANRKLENDPRGRKIFTSSAYYNDEKVLFPTLEQQVELCQNIISHLESESIDSSRAAELFEKQRKRNLRPQKLSLDLEDGRARKDTSSECLSDGEYEAPGTKVTRSQTSKFKPFLDSACLKSIERLKASRPDEQFSEHSEVPVELSRLIVEDLRSCQLSKEARENRGARMFERRQLQSSDWIVATPTTCGDSDSNKQSAGGLTAEEEEQRQVGVPRPSLSEETVMVADEEARVMFLVPLVVSHASEKLKRATITKTCSFSASSRRVIECDSPDLLTSRDEEDDDELAEGSDSVSFGSARVEWAWRGRRDLNRSSSYSGRRSGRSESGATRRSGGRDNGGGGGDYLSDISERWKSEQRRLIAAEFAPRPAD